MDQVSVKYLAEQLVDGFNCPDMRAAARNVCGGMRRSRRWLTVLQHRQADARCDCLGGAAV